jgi:RNAse (barnase) inhibitor barstar
MAPFDLDSSVSQVLDWRLAANGPVTKFWDLGILAESLHWLVAHEYDVVSVAAAPLINEADLHRAIALALDFPDYYGANLAALNDCLSDVAGFNYGTTREATGLVLVFRRFDRFAARQPRVAHAVLDIFASQARSALLIGHRMICLVQSDDPDLRFEPVGASPVSWNDAEWLDAKRHR